MVLNSANFSDVASVPSALVMDWVGVLVRASNVKMVVVVSYVFSPLAITRTRSSSSSGVLSVPSVSSSDRASIACYLTPGRCTMSKSNSDRRSRHCESFPVASAKWNTYQSKSCSVRMVNRGTFHSTDVREVQI